MRKLIVDILVGMGMTPSLPKLDHAGLPEALFVLLDGRIIGSLMSTQIEKVVSHIRRLKVSAISVVGLIFLLVTFSCFCFPFYHMPHSTCRFLLIWRLDLFHLLRVEHILVCTFLLRHLGSFDLSEIFHVQKETRILSSLGHLSR